MWNLENGTDEPVCRAEKDTEVENKHMDIKGGSGWGGVGGGMNWAIGIDTYTLMCIKLMTNKKINK